MVELLTAIVKLITKLITRGERKDSVGDEFLELKKEDEDDVTTYIRKKK